MQVSMKKVMGFAFMQMAFVAGAQARACLLLYPCAVCLLATCIWSPFVWAHTGDGFPYVTTSCDKKNQRIVVSEKTAESENEIPKDKNSMSLNGMLGLSPSGAEEGILKVKNYLNKVCKIGKVNYRIIVKPHVFNRRVQGVCGAAAPSAKLTVYRNEKVLMHDFIFSINCFSEGALDEKINEISIDERSLIATFSTEKNNTHKNITVPFDSFPSLKRDVLFDADQSKTVLH